MKKLTVLIFVAILLLQTGCAAQNSAPPSLDAQTSLSESAPQIGDKTDGLTEAPQSFESEAAPAPTYKPAPAAPKSVPDNSIAAGELNRLTERVLADSAKFLSSKPAAKSWPAAYESFYNAYPLLEQYKFEQNTFKDVELRGKLAYFTYDISPADISEIYCGLSDSRSPAANIFTKFFIKDGHLISALLNFAGTEDYFGEGMIELSALPWERGDKIATINMATQFDVGRYDNRTSMTMTAGIEAQLLEQGFSPETSVAYALSIPYYAHGVCFVDGERISFYMAGDSIRTPQYLRIGGVYPFMLIAQDIHEHIDEIDPEPEPVPVPEELHGDINPVTAKPVIYLYPEKTTNISVALGYPEEEFTYTYPAYEGGWRVRAEPDGTLTNLKDGSTHYYLFWEGDKKIDWDLSEGFVIKGSDTEAFLREKLELLGLIPREYNDFITYWAPEMSKNAYNLISFSTEQYEALAPLDISPKPDSLLRVHMVYKGLEQPVIVRPQTLAIWRRSGFAAVEWGGSRA